MAKVWATNDLTFQICDLWGAPLNNGMVTEHLAGSQDLEFKVNDMSTADITIDIYHPAGSLVQKPNNGLSRLVKVFYEPTKTTHPVYAGILLEPEWHGAEATLQLSFVDVVFRLQRAHLATSYSTPPGGKDIGQIMVDVLGRAANRPYPIGAPGLGVLIGTINATYNINREWDAGECIWDILAELAQLAGAPDMRFVPLDRQDGVLWRFDALAPLGADVSATAIFEYNTGLDNCLDMVYAPSGDPVENYYSALGQPPDDGSLVGPTGHAKHQGSIDARGLYEGWDSNDATDLAVERAKAQEMVSAYNSPPDFISIVPKPEGAGYPVANVPPPWDVTYGLGDTVRAVGRKGTMSVDELARVNDIHLADDEESGDLLVSLEVAPRVDATGVTVF